jgi:glutamate-1-semialdehyde 2,1-aminomutase
MAKRVSVPIQIQSVGSLFSILFVDHPVRNYQDSLSIDPEAYASFFHYLLQHGVYMPPSSVDAACLSYAHTPDDIDATVKVCERAFHALASASL